MVKKIVAEMFQSILNKAKLVPKVIILRGDAVQSQENSLAASDVRYKTSVRVEVPNI